MFRIRKISNPFFEGNKHTIERINGIIRAQFPALQEKFIKDIYDHMVNPDKTKSSTFLMVADDFKGNIRGFAVFMHISGLKICFLDLLAVNPGRPTSGVGGAIYERVKGRSFFAG